MKTMALDPPTTQTCGKYNDIDWLQHRNNVVMLFQMHSKVDYNFGAWTQTVNNEITHMNTDMNLSIFAWKSI